MPMKFVNQFKELIVSITLLWTYDDDHLFLDDDQLFLDEVGYDKLNVIPYL